MRRVPRPLVFLCGFYLVVYPASHGLEGLVELHHKVQGVILIGCVAGVGSEIGGISFYFRIAYFCDMGVLQIVGILTGSIQIDEHSSVTASFRKGVGLYRGMGCSRYFGLNPGVGHVDGILPYFGHFGLLVYAGTVSGIGVVFGAGVYLKLAACGLHQESVDGPVAKVIETGYVFYGVFVTGFPGLVFIVGCYLYHAERQ